MPIRLRKPRQIVVIVPLQRSAVPELLIPPVRQWGGEWCWAACAEMVLGYYELPKEQCAVVDQFLETQNCCTGTAPDDDVQPGCDQSCQPDDVAEIYDDNGLTATIETGPIVFGTFETEIKAKRPVQVEVWLDTGLDFGRHMVLVTWAGTDDGEDRVSYNDPWAAHAYTHRSFADFETIFADNWWREIRKK